MIYCSQIVNRFGFVIASNSPTNAGVDYISAYKKLFDLSLPGDRVILLCTSGNLSIIQRVVNEGNSFFTNWRDQIW